MEVNAQRVSVVGFRRSAFGNRHSRSGCFRGGPKISTGCLCG